MKKTTMSMLFAIAVLALACTPNTNNATNPPAITTQNDGSTFTGKVLAGSTTPYLEFTKADYDKALAEQKIIVLNFYANWCPSCQAEHPEALRAFNTLEANNVVGFRVNFKDSETDADEAALAKQFAIPYQHTKVVLKDGAEVARSSDNWDSNAYLAQIAKYR